MNHHSLLGTSLVLALSSSLAAQYLYDEQPGLITGPTVRSEGCLLVDIDGDGDLDAVFANGYVLQTAGQAITPTVLVNKINQGQGFVDETNTRIPTQAINGTLAVAFDIENDGDLDLVFSCNGNSQQRLYVNDGTGVFTDESVARFGAHSLTVAGCAYGDVDQDGDYDIFFNDELNNGQLKLFLNDGTGNFTNVTSTHVAPAPKSNQQDVVLFDVDNDFDLDCINVGKSSGQQIYFNDGTGKFLTVTTSLLPNGGGSTYEAEAADLDHDGDLDLTILATNGLTDAVVRNELIPSGTLTFTTLTSALTGGNGQDDNEWLFVDSNNDGFLDLVNGTLTGGAEKLYVNNGSFSFALQTGNAGFSPNNDPTLDMAVGDINGDGIFDVLTAQGEFGNFTNRAYYGTGPADTQPPRFVQVEQLDSLLTNPAGPWVIRASIQDSMVDDGETSIASVTVGWTIDHMTGTATGSTEMRFLGGLLYRADVMPPADLIVNGATVEYTITATDLQGNSTTTPLETFALCGLQQYGVGIGGTNSSLLSGTGSTSPGGTVNLYFEAAPSTTGLIAYSLAPLTTVIPQGTVLIDGFNLIAVNPISTNFLGFGLQALPVPPIPGLVGLHVDMQCLFDTPFSLSNALDLVICP